MSQGAKSVLAAFEQLPASEREEVVQELLRRSALEPHEGPGDEELVRTADGVLLGLDRRESQG